MARWISPELRQTVAARGNLLCEYCLVAEADTFYGCEVDHIVSLKHGGSSEADKTELHEILKQRSYKYGAPTELSVKKKKTTRTIEISIKTDEYLVIKQRRSVTGIWCARCGKETRMVRVEDLKSVVEDVEPDSASGHVHCTNSPEGLLICLDSLNASREM